VSRDTTRLLTAENPQKCPALSRRIELRHVALQASLVTRPQRGLEQDNQGKNNDNNQQCCSDCHMVPPSGFEPHYARLGNTRLIHERRRDGRFLVNTANTVDPSVATYSRRFISSKSRSVFGNGFTSVIIIPPESRAGIAPASGVLQTPA
jgi:hypothetical protein